MSMKTQLGHTLGWGLTTFVCAGRLGRPFGNVRRACFRARGI
jgi:hypothetical protein